MRKRRQQLSTSLPEALTVKPIVPMSGTKRIQSRKAKGKGSKKKKCITNINPRGCVGVTSVAPQAQQSMEVFRNYPLKDVSFPDNMLTHTQEQNEQVDELTTLKSKEVKNRVL
ncbi:hypothetical protein F2Q69_00021133 [Brassica cretica]|uniref:Uncharacterized protein n=1 Tax=Brassica cretica TaxID=69181 RepID=A0A8S9QDN9_BRACR|nr:hypothetical protein F2Q69_00021133 [Brassica cretica]